jgi:hypothetical protein
MAEIDSRIAYGLEERRFQAIGCLTVRHAWRFPETNVAFPVCSFLFFAREAAR